MTLAALADVATIAEAIFVIVSVVFIWLEVRRNTRLTRAANTQTLVELVVPVNLQLAQDRELAELWLSGATQFAELDPIDQARYRYLLFGPLTFHENVYYQWKKKLIDEDTYESWRRSFEPFVQEHNLATHWDDIKGYYQPEFAAYVTELIDRGVDRAGDAAG